MNDELREKIANILDLRERDIPDELMSLITLHSEQQYEEGYKKGWIDAKLEENTPEAGDA